MANKNTVNSEKSLALIIPPKIATPIPHIQLNFNNDSVTLEDFVKYVRITIDARLNFDVYISTSVRKISSSLHVITKLKQILPRKTLHSLYDTMIHSYLLYGIAIWENTYVIHLKRLNLSKTKLLK